jgi:hypothetical protein
MAFEPLHAAEIELKAFKNSPTALNMYIEGKELIKKCGLINMLRVFARPFTFDRGSNVNSAAYSAAFTEGYNKALDDLMYFEDMYLKEELGKKKITATFGALGLAIKKGDLKPGE